MRPTFGAGTPDHRALIRADLAQALADQDALDLKKLPGNSLWSVSISHAPDLGGWIAAPKPDRLGFDLEVRARVREAAVRRMCAADELALVGDPALLWSAKEAMFKCVAVEAQPTSLSALAVTAWTQVAADEFRFSGAPVREGFVIANATHAAAICLA